MKDLIIKLVTIEDYESCFDEHMKSKIISISYVNNDPELLKISFDLKDFIEYNKNFEKSNYFNDKRVPCLTAREAGCYPENEIEFIYFDTKSPIKNILKIIEN